MKLFNLDVLVSRATRDGQRHHRPVFEFCMGFTPDDWEMIIGKWDVTFSRIKGRERCRCGMKPCLSAHKSAARPALRLV